ncbi:MAG: FkbM family methyltransferase [Nitrososphaerota archaeon]|nr:FkbM family methyltransferase [Nitrososphaerota archaeon]MDG7040706.1 FkbM family methyltransferase [Nitrososphaerota archaeon]
MAAIIECFILDVYKTDKIKTGDYVIDAGAGIGEFALIASSKVGSTGKVLSIEPSLEDYQQLIYNLDANKINNVVPINMAISDRAETLKLEFKEKSFTNNADTLENIAKFKGITLDKVTFIKMDIEGAECKVLPTAMEKLTNLKTLSIEMHNGCHRKIMPLMQDHGFEFHRISKREYLLNSVKAIMKSPFSTYKIYKEYKRSGEFTGFRKVAKGIEISSSESLIVGTFSKLET